jgi:type II secretory pathway component GspD/PulD (secretin)
VSNVALFASFANLLHPAICYSKIAEDVELASLISSEPETSNESGSGYTVNFNNVPVVEVIRFVSKITNMNFIFADEEVQFNVTIISEEPITVKNIMSALIQVLRINQLTLLEQDNSLIITKSTDVTQIPTIVSGDLPDSKMTQAPIITRVFRIKNASVASIATIIRPMTSKGALIEVSAETRQLIVTDITTNVDKIALLLASLDAPHTPLEIDSYEAKNISPKDIIALTTQILSPFSEGNPLIFVPQNETDTIFVVSTPYLIERAMTVMEDVDVPAKTTTVGNKQTAQQSVFVYKIINKNPTELLSSLYEVESQLEETNPIDSASLIKSLQSAKYISNTNSILFISDATTWPEVQAVLAGIDTASGFTNNSELFVYKVKNTSAEQLENQLKQMSEHIQDKDILDAIDNVKLIKDSNTLIFNGTPAAIQRIETILPTLDVVAGSKGAIQTFIYKPVNASEEQLTNALNNFAENLDPKSPADKNLAQTIAQAQWLGESGSFVFRGNEETLTRLKEILVSLDNSQGFIGATSKGFFIYKLQYAQGDVIIDDLNNLASVLVDADPRNKPLQKSISHLKWIKENNTILITGSANMIDQIKALIGEFDIASTQSGVITPKSEFFIYKAINRTPEQIVESLSYLADDLEQSGLIDADLLHTMISAKIVASTQSIIFTGTPQALEKLKGVLQTADVIPSDGPTVQTIGKITFLIYKIKYADPTVMLTSMKSFASDLAKSSSQDKEISDIINSAKYIKETNSILFTGPEDQLSRVEKLADKFDVAPTNSTREPASSYVVYNPKYQSGDELISILCDFMQNLQSSGVTDPTLFDTISHLKYIEKTNSLVITGSPESIAKVEQLLVKFDTPGKEGVKSTISSIDSANFLIYKLQYHKGSEIQSALKEIAVSLNKTSGTTSKNLIDAINSLQWIQVTNSLLGTGDPDMLAKLKELIESIDVPLRQVFIEVLVIETSLINSQNFGLQWGSQLQYLNKTIGAGGNFPLPLSGPSALGDAAYPGTIPFAPQIANTTASTPPSQSVTSANAIPFTSGFDLGVIGDIIMHKGKSFISLGGLVNALQVDNATTFVMNPKIITQDGHTSTIFVGQNLPFTGSFVSNTSSNTTQTSNIEYRDVGVNLTITPTLGTNNVITLDISQDISAQIPNPSSAQNVSVNGISTSHTSMSTRVHVPDNHFLVLSGMIQDNKNNFRSGIPCLGGLPVVGALFAQNDRYNSKDNIIIFMRPIIIDSFEDYDRVTEGEEAMYKQSATTQLLKEEFDNATEMIKALGDD